MRYEERKVSILNDKGEVVFEKTVLAPPDWSDTAVSMVASKYLAEGETSIEQMLLRVVNTIADAGEENGYFKDNPNFANRDDFHHQLLHTLYHQQAAFNSPVYFNVGVQDKPMVSACQPYDALVVTNKGLKKIGDIVTKNLDVKVFDGKEYVKILARKHNGKKGVYRFNLNTGGYFDVTSDHLVCAHKSRRLKKVTWKKAQDIKVGDWVRNYRGGKVKSSSFEEDSLAALVGWLQTDGYVGQPGNATSLILEFETVNDDEFNWVTKHLGIAYPGLRYNIIPENCENPDLTYKRIRFYGEEFRNFANAYGLLTRNPNQKVPDQILESSDYSVITSYLKSVFQADGYCSIKNGRPFIGLSKCSREMIVGVQHLLNELGIFSRTLFKKDKREDRHDQWCLYIAARSEVERFNSLIGFIGSKKQQKLDKIKESEGGRTLGDLRYCKVTSIETLGGMDVYDIQTESEQYLTNYVLVHNCFITNIEDNMESIMEFANLESKIFKRGGGLGGSLSKIRSCKSTLSGGGTPSGPVSFMEVYDSVAGIVKSGGKTRRAALMLELSVRHPDILDFVKCKKAEEEKARAIRSSGLDVDGSVRFQNANISVQLDNAFMGILDNDSEYSLKGGSQLKASEVFDEICKCACDCGDPGVQFIDTIELGNTCKASGRISSSNPCGEFVFLDNSACNLASINLLKHVDDNGAMLMSQLRDTVRVMFTAQDILIDLAEYPSEEIAKNSKEFRPLGLGYTNLGACLIRAGRRYGGEEACEYTKAVTKYIHEEAVKVSQSLAKLLGPFTHYEKNKRSVEEVLGRQVEEYHFEPVRNAQFTLLAPTGTISFMMDCDTFGIEPEFSLVKYKNLIDGGVIKTLNKEAEAYLKRLGLYEAIDILKETGKLEAPENVKSVLATAMDGLTWKDHLNMLAAAQPYLSGAISKTINLPSSATPEDISKVIWEAYTRGLKSVTVYRDGSKGNQPLITSVSPQKTNRVRMQDTRQAITHKFKIGSHEGYLTVGLYDDGMPGELFVSMSKEGSTLSGLLSAFSISVSLGLQCGVPLQTYIDKFSRYSFEPSGLTKNKDVRFAQSIVDYIFRWMEHEFLEKETEKEVITGETCQECGSLMIRLGACSFCKNCGTSGGCS